MTDDRSAAEVLEETDSSNAEPAPSDEPLSRTLRKLGAAGPLALVALVFPPLGGLALLGTLEIVGPWLKSHEIAGLALYIAAFAILSGFALLPTYAQAILGGWAFGFAVGFPAALAGFAGGSIIGYVIARRAASERVMAVLAEHPKWLAIRDALIAGSLAKAFGIITLVRVPPNSPFAISNLVLGSTRVPFIPYVAGTLIGMAPRTAVAVFLAEGVRDLTIDKAREEIETPTWLIISGFAITIAVVIVLGVIANRAVARITGNVNDADAQVDSQP